MTAFNFFSHGTQDLYPTFLRVQHGFCPHEVGLIAVIYNIGAIIGGISFGALSERFGRRRIDRDRRDPVARRHAAVGVFDRRHLARRSARSSCRSWCRAPGAWSRCI